MFNVLMDTSSVLVFGGWHTMSVPGAVGQRMTRGSLLLEPRYLSAPGRGCRDHFGVWGLLSEFGVRGPNP